MEKSTNHNNPEIRRLLEDQQRTRNWKRWGPYLSERQWGTVREDYSPDGTPWSYFPHDHARSRAYRWGEDGLLGITDRECRLCFAPALWNERDPILKERLFGLSIHEGNHGEDVKEEYFYLDATPTHSYMQALYRYPQREFPYVALLEENHRRGYSDPEFELADTRIFDDNRFFDVFAEYAKADCDDLLIRFRISNRGPESARLHLLPTLWFHNTWSWGRSGEGYWRKPRISRQLDGTLLAEHESLGSLRLAFDEKPLEVLFTENETNTERLFRVPNSQLYVKDAFHEYLVRGNRDAVNPTHEGTKAAAHFVFYIPANGEVTIRLRLSPAAAQPAEQFGSRFDKTFAERVREADEFYAEKIPSALSSEETRVSRQAYAGLLWSKQYYHFDVRTWLEGDPAQPTPPPERLHGRDSDWAQLFNRDVISVPDNWEYPWYAAWDLAFHMIPYSRIDPEFAKQQLLLFLREWYMLPSGQLPAYEFAFGDANPPMHAWVCWRVYKMTGERGKRDREFLERVFHKLLINFTWWVNRKDPLGRNIFAGGFLGLDNIGVFDRSQPLPGGGTLEQADCTAWMAFYCTTMLSIALELAKDDPSYEDIASKFFEHFMNIADAMNRLGGRGLWDEDDGFYYDWLQVDGQARPLRLRSLVGVIPLFAVEVLEADVIEKLPGFKKRMLWFLENRKDIAHTSTVMQGQNGADHSHRLLAIPTRERLVNVLRRVLDENEFLSPYGIRSLSKFHGEHPYTVELGNQQYRVGYVPGDSDSSMFGGNSNWRGPIWFPLNYLLIEALERYDYYYGNTLTVEYPTGSGRQARLKEIAQDLAARLSRLFLPDASGKRPLHGDDSRYAQDPGSKDLILFYECFNGDTGSGVGASHQTGWTALVAKLMESLATDKKDNRTGRSARQKELRQ